MMFNVFFIHLTIYFLIKEEMAGKTDKGDLVFV